NRTNRFFRQGTAVLRVEAAEDFLLAAGHIDRLPPLHFHLPDLACQAYSLVQPLDHFTVDRIYLVAEGFQVHRPSEQIAFNRMTSGKGEDHPRATVYAPLFFILL